MPTQLSLPRQGPWNLVWVKQVFELSEVELTEFHCIRNVIASLLRVSVHTITWFLAATTILQSEITCKLCEATMSKTPGTIQFGDYRATEVPCGSRLNSQWWYLVFMGFVVRDLSCAVEFSNYGGPTVASTTIDSWIIFLILLKIGWNWSTCVRMTPVKSFLYQTTRSKVTLKNPNAPYMSIIGWGAISFAWKS